MDFSNVTFKRHFFFRRTVSASRGGVIADGPFTVKLGNFNLVYSESGRRLTIPVELLGDHYDIGFAAVEGWDHPPDETQMQRIRANVLQALDFIGAKYTNPI